MPSVPAPEDPGWDEDPDRPDRDPESPEEQQAWMDWVCERDGDPFYGPIVFGTNGRSAVLTEWPGGGFIGIHGTDRPGILPGAVSHGCIRMVNRDIRRLAKLMPIGTPLTIT